MQSDRLAITAKRRGNETQSAATPDRRRANVDIQSEAKSALDRMTPKPLELRPRLFCIMCKGQFARNSNPTFKPEHVIDAAGPDQFFVS